MEKYQKGPSKLGITKKSGPQPHFGYSSCNLTLAQRKPHMPPLLTPVTNASKKQTSVRWLQALMGLISHDWE